MPTAPTVSEPEVVADDPREREEWFERLPERAKEDFRTQWRQRARREEVAELRRRERRLQCIIEAVSVLVVVELYGYGFGLLRLLVVVMAGVGLGAVWHRWCCGRAASVLTALGAFWAVRMTFGWRSLPSVVVDLMVLASFAMAVAFSRERGWMV